MKEKMPTEASGLHGGIQMKTTPHYTPGPATITGPIRRPSGKTIHYVLDDNTDPDSHIGAVLYIGQVWTTDAGEQYTIHGIEHARGTVTIDRPGGQHSIPVTDLLSHCTTHA